MIALETSDNLRITTVNLPIIYNILSREFSGNLTFFIFIMLYTELYLKFV
jgi:hypothetical protein